MKLSDEFLIPIPRARVWDLLMDPEILRRCIPGCQSLEGSVGSLALTDMVAPASFRISGNGNGGAAGLASGGADVTLEDTSEGTRLTYVAEAKISGKLAQLGSRLITASVAKLSRQFFATFAEIAAEGPK